MGIGKTPEVEEGRSEIQGQDRRGGSVGKCMCVCLLKREDLSSDPSSYVKSQTQPHMCLLTPVFWSRDGNIAGTLEGDRVGCPMSPSDLRKCTHQHTYIVSPRPACKM